MIFNFPGVIADFSRRSHGNTSLCYGPTENSLASRRDFLETHGIDYRDLVCAKQIHASTVKYVHNDDKGKGALSDADSTADTDAFITDKKGLPLAIFTADCLSIFLYDPKSRSIGLIHSGWRSSKEFIAVKAVNLMQKEFGAQTQDIYAGLGPAMRACCYEVGREFQKIFPRDLTDRGGRFYLDLAGVNKKQLLSSGVEDKNIFDTKICTVCRNDEFFSFRKEGSKCGRIMSVAMLVH